MKNIALALALTTTSLPLVAQADSLAAVFPQATIGAEYTALIAQAREQKADPLAAIFPQAIMGREFAKLGHSGGFQRLQASFDQAFDERTVTLATGAYGRSDALTKVFPQGNIGGEYLALIAQAQDKKFASLEAIFPQASWGKI